MFKSELEIGANPGLSQPCFEQPGHDLIDMQGGSRQGKQLHITTQWKKITKNEVYCSFVMNSLSVTCTMVITFSDFVTK